MRPGLSFADILMRAIQYRRCMIIVYTHYRRTIEPFTLGLTHRGTLVLSCWQRSGGSHSGQPVGWKLLEVGKIADATLTDTTFSSTRPGYNRHDPRMSHIYLAV